MKKVFKITMFVLSFMGLFIFTTPKLAKADPGLETEPDKFCVTFRCSPSDPIRVVCGPDPAIVYLTIAELCGVIIIDNPPINDN